MKKILLIVFVAISAIAAAATLNAEETSDNNVVNAKSQTYTTPQKAVVAKWD